MSVWTQLDALYTAFSEQHKSKMFTLRIAKAMDPFVVRWRTAAAPPVQALLYTVTNTENSSTHYVGIAADPITGHIVSWCGDSKYAESQGVSESPCNFHRAGGHQKYLCKHCCFVLHDQDILRDNQMQKKILKKLLPTSPQSAESTAYEELQTVIGFKVNTLVYGPTGSLKTTSVMEQLNKMLPSISIYVLHITSGLKDIEVLCKYEPNSQTEQHATEAAQAATLAESKPINGLKGLAQEIINLLARFLPNIGRPGWVRIPGELVSAFTEARDGDKPVVVVLEELTRSSEPLRRLLIKAMDNQMGYYTLHDFTQGKYIKVPEDKLFFVATANLSGHDTTKLDDALCRRFVSTLFFDYDQAREKKLLAQYVSQAQVTKIMRIAQEIRTQHIAGNLPRPLDTGSLIEWAKMIKRGLPLKQAARVTWVNRIVETTESGYQELGQIDAIMDRFRE